MTDAYLAALASGRPGSLLATLDEAMARSWPEVAFLVSPIPDD